LIQRNIKAGSGRKRGLSSIEQPTEQPAPGERAARAAVYITRGLFLSGYFQEHLQSASYTQKSKVKEKLNTQKQCVNAGYRYFQLNFLEDAFMDFFNSAVDVLQTLVIALGAGLCLWGGINLL